MSATRPTLDRSAYTDAGWHPQPPAAPRPIPLTEVVDRLARYGAPAVRRQANHCTLAFDRDGSAVTLTIEGLAVAVTSTADAYTAAGWDVTGVEPGLPVMRITLTKAIA